MFKEIEQEIQLAHSVNSNQKQLLCEIFRADSKRGIFEIAKHISQKYHFKTIMGKKEELFVYQDGVYDNKISLSIIDEEIGQILGSDSSTHYVKEITGHIKRMNYVRTPRGQFEEKNKDLICVKNGILNLRTRELIGHEPKYVFLSKLPVQFDPEAKAPTIQKFLETTLYPEDIPIIQEFAGYCLYREYFIKKAIILTGEAHGGKSTLLDLLEAFVGEKNTTGIALQRLRDRFSSVFLEGKLINIYDDLEAQDVDNTGAFKMLTGRSPITAEVKFGEIFTFHNYAKLIFSCNRIPKIRIVDDDAYYSRWIPMRFDQIFDENNSDTDVHLLEKITIDSELSGFLNLALDGLDRLFENKKFSYNKTTEEIRLIMQKASDTLAAFAQDELEQKDGNWISKNEMYERYNIYAAKQGIPRVTKDNIGKNLANYTTYIVDSWEGSKRGWRNVCFKNGSFQEKIV